MTVAWLIILFGYLAIVPAAIRAEFVYLDKHDHAYRSERQMKTASVIGGWIWPLELARVLVWAIGGWVGRILFAETPRRRKERLDREAAEAERWLRKNDPESAAILAGDGGVVTGVPVSEPTGFIITGDPRDPRGGFIRVAREASNDPERYVILADGTEVDTEGLSPPQLEYLREQAHDALRRRQYLAGRDRRILRRGR